MSNSQVRRPIVWVVKEQVIRNSIGFVPMDFTPAHEYGDIEFITQADLPLYGKGTVLEQWNRGVVNFVKRYDPKLDYVIPTGQPTAIFAVGYALGMLRGVAPRFLVWRREENRYKVLNFDGAMPSSSRLEPQT